ncbi:MAG: hypothetical protein ACKVQA_12105, partial [Burkholderiales bacterium]
MSGTLTLDGINLTSDADIRAGSSGFTRAVDFAPSSWLNMPLPQLRVNIRGNVGSAVRVTISGRRLLTVPASITPHSLILTRGITTNLSVALSPPPTAAGTLAVRTISPSGVTSNTSVAFAAGAATVSVPFTATALGISKVQVQLNGRTVEATLRDRPTVGRVRGVGVEQDTLNLGWTSQFKVVLQSLHDVATTVALVSTGLISHPASLVIPAGALEATFSATPLALGSGLISAISNGSEASSPFRVISSAQQMHSITPGISRIQLGARTTLKINLSAASNTPTTVALSTSTGTLIGLPASVTVPAGQRSVELAIVGRALGTAMIKAEVNNTSAQSVVQIVSEPAALTRLDWPDTRFTSPTFGTTRLAPGARATFGVRINSTLPEAVVIQLSALPAGVIDHPATITVPAGEAGAEFNVRGRAAGEATLTATLNGRSLQALVSVIAQATTSGQLMEVLPPWGSSGYIFMEGNNATASAYLRFYAAEIEPRTFTLTSSPPGMIQHPASVTVAPDQQVVRIPIRAMAVSGDAVLSATFGTTSSQVNVRLLPQGVSYNQTQPAATAAEGTPFLVRFPVIPKSQPDTLYLTSSAGAIQVPQSIYIPSGEVDIQIPVIALAEGSANIDMQWVREQSTVAGRLATASVTAPAASSIALTPQAASVYAGSQVEYGAQAVFSDGAYRGIASEATWGSSAPSIVSMTASGVATGLAAGTSSVTVAKDASSQATSLTVLQPAVLSMSAATTQIKQGETVTVTVTSAEPGPDLGLAVTLSGGGTGGLQIPTNVTIPAGQSQVSFGVTGTTAGLYIINASAPGRTTAGLAISIDPSVEVSGVSPSSAPPGATIRLTGRFFDPTLTNNTVTFTGGAIASVASVSATTLDVIVPGTAQTGPITVRKSTATAQSPVFTVLREQDFSLTASPASQVLLQGSEAVFALNLVNLGTANFTGLVSLRVLSLPAGITARFGQSSLVLNQTGTLTLDASPTATTGLVTVVIEGQSLIAGSVVTRTAQVSVNVQAATGQTGVKGRFITPLGQGIAGVRVSVGSSVALSDAAGNFLLTGLPAGDISLRMDATPANPLYPIWPVKLTLVANQVALLPDWTVNPPPADPKFVPIANSAQEQVITDPRFPGLEIRLPAGVTITGWDGVVKNRIAVEKVEIAKLAVPPPPTSTGAAYQLYFGTPMGGVPSAPIPVTLPNDVQAEPGESVNVWFFDGSPMGGTGEWKVAGQGIVSADGKSVRMPNGTGIPRFCGVCGLTCLGKTPPAPDIAPSDDPEARDCAGNPVDLSNGQEMPTTGGLRCGGLTPISTGMTYNPVDAFNNIGGIAGSLGFGWVMDYDIAFLPFAGPQKRLILPANNRVNLVDDGTGNYKPVDDPRFDGAVMRATNLALNEWELKFRDGRIWRFQPFSPVFVRGGPATFVTEMVDPQGNVLTINRQSNGRIASIGSAARNVTMSYGANGFVSEIRDSANRVMRYTYNADNRIETLADPDNRITRYTYVGDEEFPVPAVCGTLPSGGKRLQIIHYPGRPNPTENFYGSDRRVLRQLGYDGTEHRFAYKVAGACVTHTSAPNTRCTGAACPDVDSWDNFQAGWRFYGGNVVSTTVRLPNGQTRSSEFSSRGIATTRTNAQGQKSSLKVDSANRITERTDALGRVWSYSYDAKGNTTQQVDPLGRLTQYTYDAVWNKPTAVTRYDDANQAQTWTFTYDPAKGTPLTATNPLNQTTTFAYTARGELQQVTNALSHTTQYGYNAAGDLTRITDALGNITRLGYDGAGRNTATTDPLGLVTGTQYNGADQVTTVTDARNKSTQMAFDAAARLSSVTNALGNVIESYGYDAGDRLTARTDAKLKATAYVYDTAGRLTSMTDRKGIITTYTYDELDRVLTMTRPEGLTRFTYDAVGRLSEITDPAGSISYRYDLVDRLVKEIQVAGGVT